MLEQMKVCECEACSNVGQLRLKQVVHAGEAIIERIGRFEKLFSLDIIIVHRLLKNTVDAREYLLLTAPAYTLFERFYHLIPERRLEHLEEVGSIETFVFHGPPLAALLISQKDQPPQPSWLDQLAWRTRLHVHSLLNRREHVW